jgi:hypothetical protein
MGNQRIAVPGGGFCYSGPNCKRHGAAATKITAVKQQVAEATKLTQNATTYDEYTEARERFLDAQEAYDATPEGFRKLNDEMRSEHDRSRRLDLRERIETAERTIDRVKAKAEAKKAELERKKAIGEAARAKRLNRKATSSYAGENARTVKPKRKVSAAEAAELAAKKAEWDAKDARIAKRIAVIEEWKKQSKTQSGYVKTEYDVPDRLTYHNSTSEQREEILEQAQHEYDQNPEPCRSCGTNDDVSVGWDPFDLDVNNKFELRVSCGNCTYERARDI